MTDHQKLVKIEQIIANYKNMSDYPKCIDEIYNVLHEQRVSTYSTSEFLDDLRMEQSEQM